MTRVSDRLCADMLLADATLVLFHCHALDLRFTAEACAARQGAVHEAGGVAYACGTGKCRQGGEVIAQLGRSVERVVIPMDHCPAHAQRCGTCAACGTACTAHLRGLRELAGRSAIDGAAPPPRELPALVVPARPVEKPKEEETMAEKTCEVCGGKYRGPYRGAKDVGKCRGCRAGEIACVAGDKEKFRAWRAGKLAHKEKGRPALAAGAPDQNPEEVPMPRKVARPTDIAKEWAAAPPAPASKPAPRAPPPRPAPDLSHLPDVRLLPSGYLVACAAEARRRVAEAAALAEAFDTVTGNR